MRELTIPERRAFEDLIKLEAGTPDAPAARAALRDGERAHRVREERAAGSPSRARRHGGRSARAARRRSVMKAELVQRLEQIDGNWCFDVVRVDVAAGEVLVFGRLAMKGTYRTAFGSCHVEGRSLADARERRRGHGARERSGAVRCSRAGRSTLHQRKTRAAQARRRARAHRTRHEPAARGDPRRRSSAWNHVARARRDRARAHGQGGSRAPHAQRGERATRWMEWYRGAVALKARIRDSAEPRHSRELPAIVGSTHGLSRHQLADQNIARRFVVRYHAATLDETEIVEQRRAWLGRRGVGEGKTSPTFGLGPVVPRDARLHVVPASIAPPPTRA